jgi:hypothetical protein
MQRPPSMSWCHANSFAEPPSTDSRTAQLQRQVAALTDPSHSIDFLATKGYSLASLSALSPHLWPVIYPSSNRTGSPSDGVKNHSLWKADFVELAGDTWLRTAGATVNSSSLAVYHIMNIMLHGNLAVLQCFAHSHPESETRNPEKSSTGREVHAWLHDRHYLVARWHAENLINTVENAFIGPPIKSKRQDSTNVTVNFIILIHRACTSAVRGAPCPICHIFRHTGPLVCCNGWRYSLFLCSVF